MIWITGDTHGDFYRITHFCYRMKTTINDILIILGDAGINYYLGEHDIELKRQLSRLPITLFCIHGNHEERPFNINTYKLKTWHGGEVYVEDDYPNLIFAKDGEIYDFETNNGLQRAVVIGGAYSIDKYYRLLRGWNWFPDEQPSDVMKHDVEKALETQGWNVDIVLTHTCPIKYEPIEWFIPGLDQSRIDKSTEQWLDKIEKKLTYKRWYCGHYHGEKQIDKLQFLFESIHELK